MWQSRVPRCRKIQRELELIEFKLLESHHREAKQRENRAVEKIKADPKYFFSYAKSKSKIRSQVGPLEEEGNIVSDPEAMSNVLQCQFTTVYSTPRLSETEIQEHLLKECCGLTDINLTEDKILEAIQQISANAAPGPDGVHPLLLRECKVALSRPLLLLWKKSIALGEIPHKLKFGLVTPIHKGDSRSKA